ncbi:lactonase family protein [Bacillus sp. 03113]|uniref:lactonase family protein n=1 Tax=Bacillus sp. 03113 TaxID=2578211 RepID=UPI0011414BE1|nr:lactonase family protein [Bacillus sp. 03113]
MTKVKKFNGFIGTYTKGKSQGIYSFTLDTEAGKISEIRLAAELSNPTYLTISNDNQYLFSVIKEGDKGGVASYILNEENSELHFINKQLETGAPPCHISSTLDYHHLLTANYHKGTIEYYLTNKDNGNISPIQSVIQHEGSGPNQNRQEKAHAHFAGFTPDEKFVVAVDLGIDKIITYTIVNDELKEQNSLSVKPGSGPRHITFHPNGLFAYAMTELSSEVIGLKYDQKDGSLQDIQYISTIPNDFVENNQGSAIHISSDGRFVYAANRGHDSIAVFSVHQETGELSLVEITSTEGNWPRDFILDPTEAFLVASNEHSENLVLFSRDELTGKLTLLQSDVFVPEPVCVKFLNR